MPGQRDFYPPPTPPRRQRGAALVVGLILLVLLTMLGVAAFGISGLLERMSGHTRDRALAFQAAELALRQCEDDVNKNGAQAAHFLPSDGTDPGRWSAWVSTASAGDANGNKIHDIWEQGGVTTVVAGNADYDGDGRADYPVPPRCLIELLGETRPCAGNESLTATEGRLYRITARGMTPSGATVVMLQTIQHQCQ